MDDLKKYTVSFIKNGTAQHHYHPGFYFGYAKEGVELLVSKFVGLGFKHYKILYNSDTYLVRFDDASEEAQFLIYFSDHISDKKSLSDITVYKTCIVDF